MSDDYSVEYVRDSRGLLLSEQRSQSPGSPIEYERDELGRVGSIWTKSGLVAQEFYSGLGPSYKRILRNGLEEHRSHSDQTGQLTHIETRCAHGGAVLDCQFAFGQDSMLSRADTLYLGAEGESSVLGRDDYGRLNRENHKLTGLAPLSSWSGHPEYHTSESDFLSGERLLRREMDAADNWVELSSSAGVTYSGIGTNNRYHDFDGSLDDDASGNFTHSSFGTLSQNANALRFDYDGLGQLVWVEDAAGDRRRLRYHA